MLSKDNTRDLAFIFLIIIMLFLIIFFSSICTINSNSIQPIVLDVRINPNKACLGDLICLPKIGISKAQAIIKYREVEFSAGNCKPFSCVEDLEKVKGIGFKTAQSFEDWLTFE